MMSTDTVVNIHHRTGLIPMWDVEYDKPVPPDCGRKVIYSSYRTCKNHKQRRGGVSVSVRAMCPEGQFGFTHIKCFTTSAHIAHNFCRFYPDLNCEFTFETIVALKRTLV